MTELEDEKKFYERFFALHNDPVLVAIYKEFGIDTFRRSCVLEGFEPFIQAAGFSGTRCVEIGTRHGLTAIVLSRYFEEVVSIDVRPGNCRAVADFAGVKNVRFVSVMDNREKADLFRSLIFDAAFVDGDHEHDTETDFALVERCGRVLFHEYWPAQPAVMTLVDRLPGTVKRQGKFAQWTR